jgi:cytochrome c peroxidase
MRRALAAGALALLASGGLTGAQEVGAPWNRYVPVGLDAFMPVPEANPLTSEKIALGRRLFFDVRLSADRTLSCASCHDPAKAFTDGRRVAVGVGGGQGRRNAPSSLNRGYGAVFFWDGRAASLEDQVLGPIEQVAELGSTIEIVVERLRRDPAYVASFRSVFRREINRDDLARALATYVRSLLAGDSPVDRYFAGNRTALSSAAQEGLKIFRGKGNCTACHLGPTFSDEQFHNTGVAWISGRLTDEGRAAVTGKPEDRGAFKTPTLRHIAETAPYMHDGSLPRLKDVIAFYDTGGHPNPHLDPELRPLRLSAAEKASLITFLRSLSGRIVH